jgi:urease accessory protein
VQSLPPIAIAFWGGVRNFALATATRYRHDCAGNGRTLHISLSRLSRALSRERGPSRPLDRRLKVTDVTGTEDGISLHLLRLVSPSLPVGAFSYSRGLEWAAEAGWVRDEATARDWIYGTLEASFARFDGPLFWRMMAALSARDDPRFLSLDAWLAAGRESREFQLEDRRMGEALLTLLAGLGVPAARSGLGRITTYPAAFAIAANHWQISHAAALKGLMWTIVEGQVAAALRLVRFGHTAGQRILIQAVPAIERGVATARNLDDHEIGNVSIAMAMASAWHETQYSRLFRS